jgi:cell division protein FtsB
MARGVKSKSQIQVPVELKIEPASALTAEDLGDDEPAAEKTTTAPTEQPGYAYNCPTCVGKVSNSPGPCPHCGQQMVPAADPGDAGQGDGTNAAQTEIAKAFEKVFGDALGLQSVVDSLKHLYAVVDRMAGLEDQTKTLDARVQQLESENAELKSTNHRLGDRVADLEKGFVDLIDYEAEKLANDVGCPARATASPARAGA